ncbi:nickel insertion protein [Clostridium thermarum]|uniref:nickel insertion protein n=1 Tax=Clostridium thermarum TaxID=1716543 RepID=UPI0013D71DEC|nr:nickel insertion protein [Clostridium thermarum]
MKIIYVNWNGGVSTTAFMAALKDLWKDNEEILNKFKKLNDSNNSLYDTITPLLRDLGCEKVISSAIEIDSDMDMEIMRLLKSCRIKLAQNRRCKYDYTAAVFVYKTQGDFNMEEGKLLSVGEGRAEGVQVKLMLVEVESNFEEDRQYIIECNIDDMNSEGYDYIFNKLLDNGALDVYLTPIIMKKGRPAVKLSVLCTEKNKEGIEHIIFNETSTFGVRSFAVEKKMLKRSFGKVMVYNEEVRVKYGYLDGKVVKAKPEYEDCKAVASKLGMGINRVYMEAVRKIEIENFKETEIMENTEDT